MDYYDIYLQFSETQLIWVKSFTSSTKDNRRCAKYYLKKLQKEKPNSIFKIIKR